MNTLVVMVAFAGPPFQINSFGISNMFRPPMRLVISVKIMIVRMQGSVIRKNVCLGDAPSISAASNSSGLMPSTPEMRMMVV